MSNNLYDVLLPAAPERDASVVLTTETDAAWTRGDIAVLAGRIAALLRNSGVEPGDRVAVQVEKSPEAVCLYLACLKAGFVYVPLNTAYTDAELAHFLGDAEPKAFVGGSEAVPAPLAASHTETFTLGPDGRGSLIERARALAPLEGTVPRATDDLAALLYTSGTTGRAKGAMITHGNLIFTAKALEDAWEIDDADVLLHALPIFHAHGLFIALNTALLAGAAMHFLPKFTIDAVVDRLPRSTLFMGVPTFYARMVADARVDEALCKSVRLFVSGSAPLSVPAFEAFRARTGHDILERYAMTETIVITTNPLHGHRVPGTVGSALPGVTVRVIDEAGRERPRGEIGEIALQGPNVFAGYWRLPEVTAAEFTADGSFKTGDLGKMEADGRLTIVGRNKDLIITGGYNVYPGEVEAVLARLDGVADCAVIGLPHADFGEGVVAVIERRPGDESLTQAGVVEALSRELARYKLPKAVVLMDSLPRNALGKIQKNELRRTHAALLQGGSGLPASSRPSSLSEKPV
ncbi:AMP-binding protein [Methylobacterium sp. E-045]|uniref:AMP-binding protein n=1 Tax=Methylobacterium sp. E-045 TaxID=2836575 RepID=UPI001FB9A2FD|nr:AMP-binding protein [Methylobacterium sp. E-045]MCJ2130761.1 AMP-binding protein [Methylobacterium sp. E-045]